jgi:SPP1 gp7 family putative phage head morphogenesis protein
MGDLTRAAIRNHQMPNYQPFVELIAMVAQPRLFAYTNAGGRITQADLLEQIGPPKKRDDAAKRGSVGSTKRQQKPEPYGPIEWQPWDIFNPEVLLAIRRQTLSLVTATIESSRVGVVDMFRSIREQIGQGLESGEAQKEINRRVTTLFDDPLRAARIAQTEAARAMHAGQLMAAEQSQVAKGFKWLASSDACPQCLELDGKVVSLGTPFYVDPKGGVYAVVTHPPRHPNCMCTVTVQVG